MLHALILTAALGAPPALPSLQDETSQEAPESELDRLIRAATTGRTVIRPQAARRLVRTFENADEAGRAEIVTRLRAETEGAPTELAGLGSALIEVLGSFGDDVLRERLWAALDDADFPWRPYAARALAVEATDQEAAAFVALLEDPIAPVRAAAVDAVRALGDRARSEVVRARLADEDDRVRRTAAECLVDRGHLDALWWLVEELRRTDRFFDRPTGEQARYDAARRLAPLLGEGTTIDAGALPADTAALESIVARVRELAGEPPALPEVARAFDGPHGREQVGLELRSCRKGEYFLRWTEDDELWVGLGNPARVALEPGTTARLAGLARRAGADTPARFTGTPGCDLEQLLVLGADARTEIWIVSKGPEAVDDLRPPGLTELFRGELLDTLPDAASEDPRLHRLRTRAAAALGAIGG